MFTMTSNTLDGTVHPKSSVLGSTPNSSQMSREEQALGLKAIYSTCRALYPDQLSPLQVTALRKFWMGGPDPLDFINMYANPGTSTSPPHWHYVTNGLSDLYGDSRLHSQCQRINEPSGFGFELTLRIRRKPGEISPPTWPAHLLQTIARYVFHSQAQLMPGDHIPWPSSLDEPLQSNTGQANPPPHADRGPNRSMSIATAAAAAAAAAASFLNNSNNNSGSSIMASEQLHQSVSQQPANAYASMMAAALAAISQSAAAGCGSGASAGPAGSTSRSLIRNMLLVEDSQLKRISTPYGYVQFLQLVGLFDEELQLVQRWSGSRVAEVMQDLVETGGDLLVTDMTRSLNLFDLKPEIVEYIRERLRREGSNLTGVTTQFFAWAPITLTALTDFIPGEIEAEAIRRSTTSNRHRFMPSQLRATKPTADQSAIMSQALNANVVLMQTLPTDLSLHRSRASPPVGDDRAFAMVTDDTVVSTTSTAKPILANDDAGGGAGQGGEDEEFIDVVGDDTAAVAGLVPGRGLDGGILADSSPPSVLAAAKSGHLHQCTSAPGGLSSKWSARLAGPRLAAAPSLNLGNATPPKRDESQAAASFSLADLRATAPLNGPLGFRASVSVASSCCSPSWQSQQQQQQSGDLQGSATPGSAGSVPCTPLAHLSLSPGSLDLMPSQVLDCLDLYLCREAGEMLPLAVSDRLRHGRHFTFLNGHCPDHAVTLVPSGVSGSFVSEDTPYVARGPWLQIFLPKDFLERLDFQFSSLAYPEDSLLSHLPLVFRWPERRLRICIVDPGSLPTASSPVAATDHWPSTALLAQSLPTRPVPCSAFLSRPPTCVPTPEAVLAALANTHRQRWEQQQQQQAQQQRTNPFEGFGFDGQTGPAILPNHDLTSQWMHMFSALMANKPGSGSGEPTPNELMARLMRAAAASVNGPAGPSDSDVKMDGSWMG